MHKVSVGAAAVLLALTTSGMAEPPEEVAAAGWQYIRAGALGATLGTAGLVASTGGAVPTGGLSLLGLTTSATALSVSMATLAVGASLVAAGNADTSVDLGQVADGLAAAGVAVNPIGGIAIVGSAIAGQTADQALANGEMAKAATDYGLATGKMADVGKTQPQDIKSQLTAVGKLLGAVATKIQAVVQFAGAFAEQQRLAQETPAASDYGLGRGEPDAKEYGGQTAEAKLEEARDAGVPIRNMYGDDAEGVFLGPMRDGEGNQLTPGEEGFQENTPEPEGRGPGGGEGSGGGSSGGGGGGGFSVVVSNGCWYTCRVR